MPRPLDSPNIHKSHRLIRNLYPLPNQVLCPKTIRVIMYMDPAKPPQRAT